LKTAKPTSNNISNEPFSHEYAEIFDLLHDAKSYAQEVDLVLSGLPEKPKRLIDLACGTGRHLEEFRRRGVMVHGNDLSENMLKCAQQRLVKAGFEDCSMSAHPMQNLTRDLLKQEFDCATAFYTALGYLVQPAELQKFFLNLKTYLPVGATLFADFWSGQKMGREFSPSREKQAESTKWSVRRISHVTHRADCNALQVQFDFSVKNKEKGTESDFNETHLVRYHTLPEVENILAAHGFELTSAGPIFDSAAKIEEAWNFYISARRKA
jgi:cyclopropane fatty-acyl-phospholipid synthase-like methyltransferase